MVFESKFNAIFMHDILKCNSFQRLHTCTITHGIDKFGCTSVFQFERRFGRNHIGFRHTETRHPHFGITTTRRCSRSFINKFTIIKTCLINILFIRLFRTVQCSQSISIGVFRVQITSYQLPFSIILYQLTCLQYDRNTFQFRTRIKDSSP